MWPTPSTSPRAGRLPTGSINIKSHFSQEESRLVDAMRWREVHRRKDIRVPGTWSAHQRLERAVDTPAGRLSEGGYTTDTNNPPLYYAAAAAVYHLSPSTALPDRVHVMRLLSALLAAVTVLFVFLFLRELLPSTPWAWPVGALAVAFQPMFAFTASGVTSDTVLYAASAGIFFAFARAFRRGLTPRRGAAIGALAAVGVLAKINMLGLAPGIAIGLLVLVIRAQSRSAPRGARRSAGGDRCGRRADGDLHVAQLDGLGQGPLLRRLRRPGADRDPVPGGDGRRRRQTSAARSATCGSSISRGSPRWSPIFDAYPLRQTWFNGFIGQFGWLDYGFADWVYDLALAIALGLVALVAKELISRARTCSGPGSGSCSPTWRWSRGLLVLIGGTSYIARIGGAPGYEQPRYLFPLLALYGALVALAARGAGRRYGPAVGVLLVSIAIAHTRGRDAPHPDPLPRLSRCRVGLMRSCCSTTGRSAAADSASLCAWPPRCVAAD